MADDKHFRKKDYKGKYYKYESSVYRRTCKSCVHGGYHSNRWDAHHLLPGVSFTRIPKSDTFAHDCLKLTDYDINKDYSMAGLPKLTAFILWYQKQDVEYKRSKERTVTMRRFGKVRKYKSQKTWPVIFPDNYPVHNPVSFGHTDYNTEVIDYLNEQVFDALKGEEEHPEPKDILQQLKDAAKQMWTNLTDIAKGPGGGGHTGIDANFRNRYGTALDGWWKPMCMSKKVTAAPISPSLR